MDRLAAMQTFIQIVEAGSLSAAARRSGRSLASTVRTLAALETYLGVRLLERTTRRLRLTDEGAGYMERAKAVLRLAEDADNSASDRQRRAAGQLTVSAPLLFGRLHVAPLMFRLLEKEPELSVRLFLTDRVVNLIEEGVDAAVRIGILPDSNLRAISIGTTRWLYCASRTYTRRRGTPRTVRDLAEHDCPRLESDGNPHGIHARFTCNAADSLVDAALSGRGIIRVLSYQVADHLRRGRLLEVLPDKTSSPLPISVVFSHPHLMAARLIAFRDALLSLRGTLDFSEQRRRNTRRISS